MVFNLRYIIICYNKLLKNYGFSNVFFLRNEFDEFLLDKKMNLKIFKIIQKIFKT